MGRPVFILGISSRSGTNFLYDLIRQHPDIDVADKVEEDFLLFGAHHLQEYVNRVSSRWDMDWGMQESDVGELFRTLGEAGLQFLRRRQLQPGLRLLTKTPEIHNLPLFFDLYPEAKLIIVVRDGRAMVESKVKSFDVEFSRASKNWAAAAKVIQDFEHSPPSTNFRIVKYEDLHQHTHESVQSLLDFLELDAAQYPFDKIDSLPVRGSSVFHGESGKLDWNPVQKTDKFKPLERFAHWTPAQHAEFNLLAGDSLEKFGYDLTETLYMKANVVFTPHDADHDLITRLDTGAKVLMPVESVELLKHMDSFLSLRKHFHRSSLKMEEMPKFLEFARVCVEQGLLQSSTEYLERLPEQTGSNQADASAVSGIFIRTCDRPQFLERILASLEQSSSVRELSIYVLDDSRDTAVRQQNEAIVARASEARAWPVLYLGDQWQRGFIERLANVFPDYTGLLGYLLSPRSKGVFSAGRLLNIAMLAFAGQRLLTFDDDYILDRAWQHQEAAPGAIRITDDRAYCLQGFATEQELLNSCTLLPQDPLQMHIDVLGKPVSCAITDSGGGLPEAVSLEGLGSDFALELGSELQGCILTTGNGVLGRPISPDASQGWFAPQDQTIPVWANNKSYEHWMKGHYIFSSYKRPSIVSTTFGMPVGIDNSRIMPPTLPVGKREDTLFAYLLHRVHDSSAHLEFPWAIMHKREARDWHGMSVESPVEICLAQVVMGSLHEALLSKSGAGAAEARLTMVGSALSEKSTLSDEALCGLVLSIYQNLSSSHRLKLMRLFEDSGVVNESIKADLEKAIQVSRSALLNQSRLPTLEDAHSPRDESARLAWLREELLLYGQSLLVWPVLWNYCRENPEFSSGENERSSVSLAGVTRG